MAILHQIPDHANFYCPSKPVPILMVDSVAANIQAVAAALKEQHLEIPIVAAFDGDHALQLLRDWAEPCPTVPPIHIIIETKMLGDAGHRFLDEIRRDPVLQPALVFVLSTAKSPYDANAAYDMNVAAVIAKDDTHVDLSNVIKLIGLYSKIITFPGQHGSIR
jgi:CheY-like chemotaxis protein